MRFFQQSQAKVHGQKPLPCTKTNKTYLAKHPSTYFFIGSQMVGFHGTSTYRIVFLAPRSKPKPFRIRDQVQSALKDAKIKIL